MAFFGVTSEHISAINVHPNADALELGKLEGMSFQFVIRRGAFKVGDEVFYFPIDTVFSDELAAVCGVLGKLAGSKKNRLKTVRLRGEISQGLVVLTTEVEPLLAQSSPGWDWRANSEDSALIEDTNGAEVETNELTAKLQVKKYEPVI
jgi:hypothetical protein